jgi:hypothetical protein
MIITRRGFLKASLAGGAVAASPQSALRWLSTPALAAFSAPLL